GCKRANYRNRGHVVTKLGILVGQEKWTFFHEIYDDLAAHYQTEVYQKKNYGIPLFRQQWNHWALQQGVRGILHRNDLCFFEWASDLLVRASHMPKQCTIVTRLHSYELYRWAPKINWDAVDKVILVSKTMQSLFTDLYPQHAHKTVDVYNGKSLVDFSPPAQRDFHFNIGMLCNIKPVKRIYEVILMFHELIQDGHDAHFYIAGSPVGDLRYATAIYRLVDKLGLQERVIFDGYVTDTPSWLQKIDIFVSNSFWEGQQVSLLEAMSSGCYCLSHWWAGAEEMLPMENLFFAESELRQKIIRYANMNATEQACHQHQLRTIASEKFDISRTKVQIRQIIAEMAAGPA
ncbi:MAG: glycosyltransferase family 4 protein, partial [Caldilineaceae bacterium]|nr:glycosyltransferase family 4 protein [Caldilineaceae bacterium]